MTRQILFVTFKCYTTSMSRAKEQKPFSKDLSERQLLANYNRIYGN